MGLGVAGQHTGFNHEVLPMFPFVEQGLNSDAHLGVGYLGALASALAADRFIKRPPNRLLTAVIGGSVTNVAIEVGQDIVVQARHLLQGGQDFVGSFFDGFGGSSGFESVKDYGVALAGIAVYAFTEKAWQRRKSKDIEL